MWRISDMWRILDFLLYIQFKAMGKLSCAVVIWLQGAYEQLVE